MMQEVLTTKEAMEYLRITRPTILKLIHEGKLKAFKTGQSYRILRKNLEEFTKGKEG